MTAAPAEPRCALFRVRGRVQGVFYRASAREQAHSLGLRGWVRNCADGDVELLACGDTRQLEALEHWLWQGPPAARVTGVERREAPFQVFADFAVRR